MGAERSSGFIQTNGESSGIQVSASSRIVPGHNRSHARLKGRTVNRTIANAIRTMHKRQGELSSARNGGDESSIFDQSRVTKPKTTLGVLKLSLSPSQKRNLSSLQKIEKGVLQANKKPFQKWIDEANLRKQAQPEGDFTCSH